MSGISCTAPLFLAALTGVLPADAASNARPRVPLEPPDGRILHLAGGTIGQYDIVTEYERAVGPELAPVGDSMWIDIPGTRPWDKIQAGLASKLAELKRTGRMLNLSVGFNDGTGQGYGSAADDVYATTNEFDGQVKELVNLLADHEVPVFLRIGTEVNGEWQGHHPYVFPDAFRKLAKAVRERGAKHVAIVWCVEPQADPAIDARDDQGRYKWFPGSDAIDWFSVDLFAPEAMAALRSGDRSRGTGRKKSAEMAAITEKLLAMARAAKKPVIVCECSPIRKDIPATADDPGGAEAGKIWERWFVPFIAWLDRHPEVKAIAIDPVDWRQTGVFADWGDSRIQNNAALLAMWQLELKKPRWVHAPDLKNVMAGR